MNNFMFSTGINVNGEIGLKDIQTIPNNPQDGRYKIYMKDGKLYILDSNGVAKEVGSGSSESVMSNATYVKEIVESEWVVDGNEKALEILASEHKQESDSVVVFVFEDGENVIVPYSIDADKNVKIFSQTAFSGKVIVSDLVSHTHGNMEVINKFSENDGTLLFDGSPIKGGGSGGNPLTTEPLEYGVFGMSGNSSNISSSAEIVFDEILNGNINVLNGKINLRENRTYKISVGAEITTGKNSINGRLQFYDESGEKIGTHARISPSETNNMVQIYHSVYFTPLSNTSIVLKYESSDDTLTCTLWKAGTSLTIQEMRSNPVNQYGGFETEVLFDGNGVNGEYVLSDNVSNYDFLFVTHEMEREGFVSESVIPKMTSNTEPEPFVASASSETQPAFGAFNGVGGSVTNTWYATGSFPYWIDIDCGSPAVVKKFSLSNGSSEHNYHSTPPKTFIFQGSNDGIIYEDLLKVVDTPKMNADEEVLFELDKSVEYKHYRWYFTEGYGNVLVIAEAKLFGESIKVENTDIIIPNGIKEHHISLYDKYVTFLISGDNLNILTRNGLNIKKVVGVKGQLPTELIGGTF